MIFLTLCGFCCCAESPNSTFCIPEKMGKEGTCRNAERKNKLSMYVHIKKWLYMYIILFHQQPANQQKLMRHADLLPFFRHWPIVYSHPRPTKNTTTSSIICNLVFSNPPSKLTPENERTNMEPQQNSPRKRRRINSIPKHHSRGVQNMFVFFGV